MAAMIARLAKIIIHVIKYLPLYLILLGFLKKSGSYLIKAFTSGRNDAKPFSQVSGRSIGEMPLNQKQNENITYDKIELMVPQEIRGVTLKPVERASLEIGKAIFVADMNGNDGKKFSSYVKMNKGRGKLEFYRENPENVRQTAHQTVVQYNRLPTETVDLKQGNSKKFEL